MKNRKALLRPVNFILPVCWLMVLSSFQVKGQVNVNIDSSYIRLIENLTAEDQKWRVMLRKNFNNELETSLPYEAISDSIQKTDDINYFQLKSILNKIGYPNYDKVGIEGSRNFWLLVQHQDSHPQFQDSVLILMKIEVDRGKAAPDNYAYLVDRVRVNTGRLQVYGTQMELDSINSTYQPKPVEDRKNLNDRRKSMGLPTIEEYTELMNERYHGNLKQKNN